MSDVLYAHQMNHAEDERMAKAIQSFPKSEAKKAFPEVEDLSDPTWFKKKSDARECKRQLEAITGIRHIIVWRNDGFAVEPAVIVDIDGLTIEEKDVLYDITGNAYDVVDIQRGDDTFYNIHLADSHGNLEIIEDEIAKTQFRHTPWSHKEIAAYKANRTIVKEVIAAIVLVLAVIVLFLVIPFTILFATGNLKPTEIDTPAPASTITNIPCEVEELSSDRRWVGVAGKGGHYADYYYISLEDRDGAIMRFTCTETLWESLKQGDFVVVEYKEETVQIPLAEDYIKHSYTVNGQELWGMTEVSGKD